jgi:hypothetical protein
MNILEAFDDQNLFGGKLNGDASPWAGWRAFLAALFALPMSERRARGEPPSARRIASVRAA